MSRTREELLDTISAEEFAYWKASDAIDSWSENRADLRAALTTAMIAWVNGNKDVKPVDFMPFSDWHREETKPREMTTEELYKLVGNNG